MIKKKLSILIVLGLMVIGLASCGTRNTEATTEGVDSTTVVVDSTVVDSTTVGVHILIGWW